MSSKVLVTPRSVTRNGHPALGTIEQAGHEVVCCTPGQLPSEDELSDLLPGCVGYLAGIEQISARVLDAATDLRVISRNGTGVDSVDLAAAERKGITVCRAAGANARGVAELAFGLILSLIRSVPFSDLAMKQTRWERRKGIEVAGRTLGLVGCGAIGQAVAQFALAFDMEVLAYDPYVDDRLGLNDQFRLVDLDDLFAASDVVSLHCPPSADGKPLVDDAVISQMKDGVYLVNTARGGLIDSDAAVTGLTSGKISGIGLDAYEVEPPTDWRLVQDPRVIATPHIGGFTEESVDRAVTIAIQQLLRVLAGHNN